jgi:hypothetical protein
VIQQDAVVLQKLVHQRALENFDQVFGFDLRAAARAVQLDHQAERQLTEMAAQLGALAAHPGRAEAAAVRLA